ncbi:MAG: hypothetical protein ACI4QT_07610, partial [Kiritimatiellia bacterium]
SGSVSHFIRGKNPLDADVEKFIEESFSIDFHPYAKLMAKHESWENFAGTTDTGWIYNQFNNRGRYVEMLNKTSGDRQAGWGIFQITDLPQANRPDVA